MWSSNDSGPRRRALMLGLAAALAGCGFTPVYAPGGAGAKLDGAVTVITPETNDGFAIRQRLQDRLGAPSTPRYSLTVTLATNETRVAVTRSQDTRRFNVLGRVRYSLTAMEDSQILVEGEYDSFTSYAATGTTVATLAAQRDAYRRLMVILADGVVDRLYVSFPETAQ